MNKARKIVKFARLIFLVLLALSPVLWLSFSLSPELAELYTIHVAPVFRLPLSFISSLFPFSVGESFILIMLLLTAVTAISGVRLLIVRLFKIQAASYFKVYAKILLYSAGFVVIAYAYGFQSSYFRQGIAETMELEAVDMTEENVVAALEIIGKEMNRLSESISFTEGEATSHGMTFDEMSRQVLAAAKKASEKYSVFQSCPFRAKPIAFSEPMAYTGISGVYTFFTGEANVNTRYSEFSMPFTTAHEYSHQMGIGSEKEAEFSALLICLESDAPYIRYSAYSQVAITLSNILFEMNENSFYEIFSAFPRCFITDVYLSALNSQKYSQTYADEIASAVNDTYLSLSGDEGVVSYSLSSQLYVAYFLRSTQ